MAGVVRFWAARGVDGFRVDAVDRLVKDLELRDDPQAAEPFPLPVHPDQQRLELIHSRDAPEIDAALGALREAAGALPMVAEVYLPSERARRYLDHFDAAFSFELLHARWGRDEIAAGIRRSLELGRTAWALSNHDFPRVATRWGEENARAAAVLLMTLGAAAFVYQGEEIGMVDGPGAAAAARPLRPRRLPGPDAVDGRAVRRLTNGEPWLPPADPEVRNVEGEMADRGSILHLFHELIALRRGMAGDPELLDSPGDTLAFRRGRHLVVVAFGDRRPGPPDGIGARRTRFRDGQRRRV